MSDSLRPHGLQHARLHCPSEHPELTRLMYITSVMPSNHLILCRPLLLLPSILPSIRVFSNDQLFGSQETPGVTGKFGLGMQNEAGQRLIEFCQENALVIANTLLQHHKRLYTWTSPDGQHKN